MRTLEMRVLCRLLPKNFDQLETFIGPIDHRPLNSDQKRIELRHKRYKIIQEAKRAWLNVLLNVYEHQIQRYDQQYHREYKELELHIRTSSSISTQHDPATRMKNIDDCLTDQIKRLKDRTDRDMSAVQRKLLRDRQHASSSKNMIGVSPEPYLALLCNPFNKCQWSYLSLGKIGSTTIEVDCTHFIHLGPSYIRLNQSATRPRKQQQVELVTIHKDIFQKVRSHMTEHQHMPTTSPILKQYSDQLLKYLNKCYGTPLSYREQLRAEEQASTAISIRKTLDASKLILRLTDKGNNFYVGSAKDFEEKAKKYFTDTNAFVELSENPFNQIFKEVCHLLNRLCSDKSIAPKHCKKMLPDVKKAELSHLYFNPKTHKVR